MAKMPASKQSLIQVAKDLSGILEHSVRTIRFEVGNPVRCEDTGGWYTSVATLGGDLPNIEIWLDKFATGTEDHFWFGFWSDQEKKIDEIQDYCEPKFLPARLLTNNDVSGDTGIKCIKPVMTLVQSKKAIIEKIEKQDFFFGIYDLSPPTRAPDLNTAADFLSSILQGLPETKDAEGIDDDLKRAEGLSRLKLRQERERCRALVNKLKSVREKSGSLVCDDNGCKFNPQTVTRGSKMSARALLDAHHKNPLKLGERESRLSDFMLLCPTCHRIEHTRIRSGFSKYGELRKRRTE